MCEGGGSAVEIGWLTAVALTSIVKATAVVTATAVVKVSNL